MLYGASIVKYPIDLQGLGYRDIKILSAYLKLKGNAKSGKISKAHLRTIWYWKDDLIRLKLIKLDRNGKMYQLRCNAAVWRIFNRKKTKPKKSKKWNHEKVFCKRLELNTRKEIQEALFQHLADTFAKQIKYVRTSGRRPKKSDQITIEAPLSASTVAKFFGYKQPCTGSRKRKKYFRLSKEPLKKVKKYLPEIDPNKLLTRYETRKVVL